MSPDVAPGTLHDIAVRSITSEGAGVGRLPDGRAVFIHRTAPGDRARVRVRELRKRWARAELVELLEASELRREPPCPHYERCGGCTLEHLRYPAQIEAKVTFLTDALERIGKLGGLPDPEVHPSPRELRYRNRVGFTLRRLADGSVVAGFHQLENPEALVDLDGRCLLPEPPIAAAWDGIRTHWGRKASRLPDGQELRLTLRALSGGEVFLLVEGGASGDWGPAARDLLGSVPVLHAVWHRASPDGEAVLVAGEEPLYEVWYGEKMEVRPGVFLQVNRSAAEHLHELVLREAGGARGRTVLDAYAGVGIYGRRLAAHGASAVGIEWDPHACAVAQQKAPPGFRMLPGRVEDRLPEALPAELVILNPPRIGVADGVMQRLADARPERIVYVSCDPATLARDVRRLGNGFAVTRIQVFDLFPQTAHVETLLTLDRR